jgi:hypothetical protein
VKVSPYTDGIGRIADELRLSQQIMKGTEKSCHF